jgi:hypothetical protein
MIILFIKLQHSAFFAFSDHSTCRFWGFVAIFGAFLDHFQLPAHAASRRLRPSMSQSKTRAARLQYIPDALMTGSDNASMKLTMLEFDGGQGISLPWAMQMKAASIEEPLRLVKSLTGAILACGGWVLSRGANDRGTVNMLFEFERQTCVEIYSVLIAAGIDLSRAGHIRLTELCQCTSSHPWECGTEIASVDLEIETYLVERRRSSRKREAA